MKDGDRTREQLLKELAKMRQRITELEESETERKRAEEEITKARDDYLAIANLTGDIIVHIDKEGRWTFLNDGACQFWGKPREKLLGTEFADYLHPDDAEKTTTAIQEMIKIKQIVRGVINRQKTPMGWRTVEWNSSPIFDEAGNYVGMQATGRDITERKWAEEALQESEKRYRNLVESVTDVIYTFSLDGTITSLNTAFEPVTGWSCFEWVGKQFAPIVHPDDLPLAIEMFQAILRGETPPMQQLRILSKSGEYVIVEITQAPQFRYGRVVGALGVARDITERKRAEEALQHKEAYFRSLIENASDAIVVLNGDGTIRYQSPSYERVVGYRPEEEVGSGMFDNIHPDDVKNVADGFAKLLQHPGGVVGVEVRARFRDGSWRTLEATANNLLHDPAVEGIVVNFRDITERRQAEEALRRGEEHFRAILESSRDEIICADLEGNLLYLNKDLSGHDPEELIGRNIAEIDVFSPEDLSRISEFIQRAIEKQTALEDPLEFNLKHKDGYIIPVEVNSAPIYLEGKLVAIVSVLRDITERKQAEEKLQKLYQQERELRQKLEEEIEAKVEFTRTLVHELKTPLTPILASSELLVAEVQEETLLRLARNINQGASGLNNRIDELLDLARGEMGMLQLDFKPVDPLQLLQRVAGDMSPLASSRGQSLILALAPSLPLVRADESHLQQVVANLVSNASKFTPKGGKITLRAKENGANLIVEVQDTGPGIAKEDQQRLFQPYYRVESDRQRLSGLGLGLALCKTLVELHGGQIWVKSRAGKGSTFGFSVPLELGADETGALRDACASGHRR